MYRVCECESLREDVVAPLSKISNREALDIDSSSGKCAGERERKAMDGLETLSAAQVCGRGRSEVFRNILKEDELAERRRGEST